MSFLDAIYPSSVHVPNLQNSNIFIATPTKPGSPCEKRFLPFPCVCIECPVMSLKPYCALHFLRRAKIPDDKILIYADNDVVFNDISYEQVESLLTELGGGKPSVLFGSEKKRFHIVGSLRSQLYWPDKWENVRFVNAGVVIGRVRDVKALFAREWNVQKLRVTNLRNAYETDYEEKGDQPYFDYLLSRQTSITPVPMVLMPWNKVYHLADLGVWYNDPGEKFEMPSKFTDICKGILNDKDMWQTHMALENGQTVMSVIFKDGVREFIQENCIHHFHFDGCQVKTDLANIDGTINPNKDIVPLALHGTGISKFLLFEVMRRQLESCQKDSQTYSYYRVRRL